VFRDKIFRGILMTALLYLIIPFVSELSIRQVVELSLTLSLSLLSFILLLLSVFLGATSLWKDMDRRYTFSVLGMPITRTQYLLGKFIGLSLFVILTGLFLSVCCYFAVWQTNHAFPPDRPIIWVNVLTAVLFDILKYILLIACAFLFSTVSTSFFLPIFGTISVFFVGSASQEVYDYVHTSPQSYSELFKNIVSVLYYVLPNFSAFNLKVNAIYGVALSSPGLLMTAGYFVIYSAIVMTFASIIFLRQDMQ
jgi:ABC-type transport system involved in multi-copper enzyme maturation permease subunit